MNRSEFTASRETTARRNAAARDERSNSSTHDDARPSSVKLAELAQIAQRATESTDRSALPAALRSGIEELSGVSMEGVRVHPDSARPAQLGAHAFAQGHDIHIAPGQERHLPHEAWHIAQQAQGRVPATRTLNDGTHINDNPALEHEADVMGQRALDVGQRVVQARTAHEAGCACGACSPRQSMTDARVPRVEHVQRVAISGAVLQGNWKCTECDLTGEGKPNDRCKGCGGRNTQVEVLGRPSFETWWKGLDETERTKILRQYGTHEKEGGANMKETTTGGAKKGDQHSSGQGKAVHRIKEDYNAGKLG